MADSGFSRPPLPQLIATIRSDLLTRFNEDVVLRRLDAEVYARVQAAAVHTLYGYIDYLARNMLPDQADPDWLVRHGAMKRCPRKPPTAAAGFVRWQDVSGTPELPAGTVLQRDDQQTYTTTEAAKAVGGVLRAPILADTAGREGNADDGIALRLVTPVGGLSSTGYADDLVGGEDIEPLETWRGRIMERWFYTPQGGADHDYVIWAKEVAGITRAWTFRHYQGIGTVGVMVASGDATHPVPPAETVTAVREHILPLAPVAGGGLFVFPATEKVIPMTIALAKDTPEIRAEVIAELNSLFLRDGIPSGTIHLSRISEAISIATGEYAHRLDAPTANIVLGNVELPVFGAVTWSNYSAG
ncbi:baseplate J/gp47 family protein [Serratia marcescens]|uniref:baseplate J/gp47 family protein n=1 Tax=Serratia marcescens TaxID=615 RepID=UPI0027E3D0AA|nr:baseplate J/gp47 family protein [Serratia marcescens]WLS21679.1 baseplate J/gp47 family protein [Serratia marcescens]HCB1485469.1 baseplate J/gp47 family protein [Serratia marcescens]HCB1615145.1 baseplate J/gp47 family protein [Serratia marcescens]HCB1620381.1 baseplate J/gp47 family protein [Serratia marcescens]HCB1836152.1 baseplate J/gp47 family protein [Serratia marcescens]